MWYKVIIAMHKKVVWKRVLKTQDSGLTGYKFKSQFRQKLNNILCSLFKLVFQVMGTNYNV